jgi:hypothetical protein
VPAPEANGSKESKLPCSTHCRATTSHVRENAATRAARTGIAASHPQTGVLRDEGGGQIRRRQEMLRAFDDLFRRPDATHANFKGLRVNLHDYPTVIRSSRHRRRRMFAGVSSGAMRTMTSCTAAAVGVMMTAHLNAVVLAAGSRMRHNRRRHHAYRRYGDEQTAKRVGESFHGTTILRREADTVQNKQILRHACRGENPQLSLPMVSGSGATIRAHRAFTHTTIRIRSLNTGLSLTRQGSGEQTSPRAGIYWLTRRNGVDGGSKSSFGRGASSAIASFRHWRYRSSTLAMP